jgi:hypothetical protein
MQFLLTQSVTHPVHCTVCHTAVLCCPRALLVPCGSGLSSGIWILGACIRYCVLECEGRGGSGSCVYLQASAASRRRSVRMVFFWRLRVSCFFWRAGVGWRVVGGGAVAGLGSEHVSVAPAPQHPRAGGVLCNTTRAVATEAFLRGRSSSSECGRDTWHTVACVCGLGEQQSAHSCGCVCSGRATVSRLDACDMPALCSAGQCNIATAARPQGGGCRVHGSCGMQCSLERGM